MKKLLLFSVFCLFSFISFAQSSFRQHGNIPYGDMVAEVQSYKYNAGSSPTEVGILKMVFGTVTTSSGVATVYLTMDGLSTGSALFTNIVVVSATAQVNTSTLTSVSLGSIQAIVNGKTLTINAVESAGILVGGQGLEFSGAVTMNFIVFGY